MIAYTEATLPEIDAVMKRSADAFRQYQETSVAQKALFLETIAAEIEALGDALINSANEETNIPAARLLGERMRTTNQLRMFAQMLKEGSWLELSIDTAIPTRTPIPKPDMRKMMVPIGPIIVFGASNFPFAYSTAGGDTASALAAGCSVVVKAHPAHAQTSEMVAGAIQKAIAQCNMPADIFQHVHGNTPASGKALVQHPATAGVGFTGSLAGGRALYDYAAERETPIPIFSEMGSVNPVVFLPDTLSVNAESLSKLYAGSITLGMGQFCTNPGLMLAVESEGLNKFLQGLGEEIEKVVPAKMLHTGIHASYNKKMNEALQQKGVELVKHSTATAGDLEAWPTVATVSGKTFLSNPLLHEEVFGPYSLMVKCTDMNELQQVWRSLKGQLSTTLMGTDKDLTANKELIATAQNIAGRIVFNGVPTGVEVCPSVVHGGPYPATTDNRFTAVGIHAVKRWVRPVCYQNCPDSLLPEALQNANPTSAWRLVNNEWTKEAIK